MQRIKRQMVCARCCTTTKPPSFGACSSLYSQGSYHNTCSPFGLSGHRSKDVTKQAKVRFHGYLIPFTIDGCDTTVVW